MAETQLLTISRGTTVCCALRIENKIFIANVGDSRAVLIKEKEDYQVTEDASPSNPRFAHWHLDRGNAIQQLGGVWRVFVRGLREPAMGLAAAIGARCWMRTKPKVTLVAVGEGVDKPEVGEIYCKPNDWLVFVSDGITPYMTTGDLVKQIRAQRNGGKSMVEIARGIAQQAGSHAESDNATIHIVPIRHSPPR